MENQHSNQWYESLARELKSGTQAPVTPPSTPSVSAAPVMAPVDFTDDFGDDGFIDTIETPVVPETDTNTKAKSKTKKKKKSDPLTNIILALSICVFLGSAGFLVYKYLVEPILLDQSMSDLRDDLAAPETNNSDGTGEEVTSSVENGVWKGKVVAEESRNSKGILTAFEKSLERNPDTVGYIQVPNTPIAYPVVQTKDNNYYLTHTFDKEYSAAGCPFLDKGNKIGPNKELSQVSVIYAHHRRNGTMFAKLKNYDNVEFYKQNPVITFDTIYDRGEWVVFADFRATTNSTTGKIFDYRKTFDFKDEKTYANFIESIRKRSYFNTPVDVNTNDQILLLSTCTYEREYWRMVIAARRVRDDEMVNGIDVSTAEKNPAPLMP